MSYNNSNNNKHFTVNKLQYLNYKRQNPIMDISLSLIYNTVLSCHITLSLQHMWQGKFLQLH